MEQLGRSRLPGGVCLANLLSLPGAVVWVGLCLAPGRVGWAARQGWRRLCSC